jgi:hypothetical protein
MKKLPIIFNAHSINGYLDGRKTETRRIIKPQPPEDAFDGPEFYNPAVEDLNGMIQPGPEVFGIYGRDGDWGIKCPYGATGGQLYVRESLFLDIDDGWCYSADDRPIASNDDKAIDWLTTRPARCSSVSCIHMPRWASRITLDVLSIRTERLQDITEAGAIAEGCRADVEEIWWQGYRDLNGRLLHQVKRGDNPPAWMIEPHEMKTSPIFSARDRYRQVWHGIHGLDAWERNDWVWVISFPAYVKPEVANAH